MTAVQVTHHHPTGEPGHVLILDRWDGCPCGAQVVANLARPDLGVDWLEVVHRRLKPGA